MTLFAAPIRKATTLAPAANTLLAPLFIVARDDFCTDMPGFGQPERLAAMRASITGALISAPRFQAKSIHIAP